MVKSASIKNLQILNINWTIKDYNIYILLSGVSLSSVS